MSWAERIALTTLAVSGGFIVVFVGISIFEKASAHLTSRSEQKRIAESLNELLAAGSLEIDVGTIAAIWAGTREAEDIIRHIRFRVIKAQMDAGAFGEWIQRGPGPGPNTYSWVKTERVRDFFVDRGVVRSEDLED